MIEVDKRGSGAPGQSFLGKRTLEDMWNLDEGRKIRQPGTIRLKRRPVQKCTWSWGEGN